MQQQYDNTNSGALFPTADEKILSGPFQFTEKQPEHVVVLELGKPGEPHKVNVYARNKDGEPKGKPLAHGTVTRTGTTTTRDGRPMPIARGMLTGKKLDEDLQICIWVGQRKDGGSPFYQLKPDSFVQRELPAL